MWLTGGKVMGEEEGGVAGEGVKSMEDRILHNSHSKKKDTRRKGKKKEDDQT